jgi:hypothetical protein
MEDGYWLRVNWLIDFLAIGYLEKSERLKVRSNW